MLFILKNCFRKRTWKLHAIVWAITLTNILSRMDMESFKIASSIFDTILLLSLHGMTWLFLYLSSRYCPEFKPDRMIVHLDFRILREVPYDEIGPIFMFGDNPDRRKDAHLTKTALISVHSPESDFMEHEMTMTKMMKGNEGEYEHQLAAFMYEFDEVNFLMSKTSSHLYVTEEAMLMYEKEVKKLARMYKGRVFIRCKYNYIDGNDY